MYLGLTVIILSLYQGSNFLQQEQYLINISSYYNKLSNFIDSKINIIRCIQFSANIILLIYHCFSQLHNPETNVDMRITCLRGPCIYCLHLNTQIMATVITFILQDIPNNNFVRMVIFYSIVCEQSIPRRASVYVKHYQ